MIVPLREDPVYYDNLPEKLNMRDSTRRLRSVAITAAMLAGLTSVAPAQAESPATDGWQFEATPYVFATGLSGTIGLQGVSADFDASFGDLVDYIDSSFMGTFKASKGPWGFGLDVIYAKLEDQQSGSWQGPGGIGSANGQINLAMTEKVYQLGLGYRVHDTGVRVDVFGAARYTEFDTDIDLALTTATLPGGAVGASGNESWWDPVIGFSVLAPIADKWSVMGYFDYGGFGVGSERTYQTLVTVNWQFSKSLSTKFGYRYLYQDYEDDSNQFIWNVATQGIYLGLGIAF